jgi:hypothetical protein
MRSIGQFLLSRLLSSLASSVFKSDFSWVLILLWCSLQNVVAHSTSRRSMFVSREEKQGKPQANRLIPSRAWNCYHENHLYCNAVFTAWCSLCSSQELVYRQPRPPPPPHIVLCPASSIQIWVAPWDVCQFLIAVASSQEDRQTDGAIMT